MRRIITVVLALVLLVSVVPFQASAAGKMVTTQENVVLTDSWGISCYCFARVLNVGDKPAAYSAGLFEAYDANGDAVASDSYLDVYGEVLAPGEYCYVRTYSDIDDSKYSVADVDDYMLTVTGSSAGERTTRRFPCAAEWKPDTAVGKYMTYNYMEATFTNDTDETIFDLGVTMALLDDNGNILYVNCKNFYDEIGVAPGSTVVVRIDVGDDILEANAANGITPTQVDAYAFIDD